MVGNEASPQAWTLSRQAASLMRQRKLLGELIRHHHPVDRVYFSIEQNLLSCTLRQILGRDNKRQTSSSPTPIGNDARLASFPYDVELDGTERRPEFELATVIFPNDVVRVARHRLAWTQLRVRYPLRPLENHAT
jgi:hypothetical protein